MKAQLGRPTGLALVLLSTLLATFLAMGVFSVAEASDSQRHSEACSRKLRLTPGGRGNGNGYHCSLSNYGRERVSFGNATRPGSSLSASDPDQVAGSAY